MSYGDYNKYFSVLCSKPTIYPFWQNNCNVNWLWQNSCNTGRCGHNHGGNVNWLWQGNNCNTGRCGHNHGGNNRGGGRRNEPLLANINAGGWFGNNEKFDRRYLQWMQGGGRYA